MKYTDDDLPDAEFFRDNPREFADLEPRIKKELMNKAYGKELGVYLPEDWPKSRFRKIDTLYDHTEEYRFEMLIVRAFIDQCLKSGKWNRTAQVMMFFRVQFYSFGPIVDHQAFIRFTDAFPMGCFRRFYGSSNQIKHPSMAWCVGIPCPDLLSMACTAITLGRRDIFEQVCSLYAGRPMKLSTATEIITVRNQVTFGLNIHTSIADGIVTVLNSRKLIPPEERHFANLIYPCLLEHHYSNMKMSLGEIARPIWTIQNHKLLAHMAFQRETRMVLLMQKFRFRNFPLHRDLITGLLGYLFAAHIDGWIREFSIQKDMLNEFFLKYPESRDRNLFCVDQEVVLGGTTVPEQYMCILDAFEARDNPTMKTLIRREYRVKLCSFIREWRSIETVYIKLISKFSGRTIQEISGEIIDYCRTRNIKLGSLYLDGEPLIKWYSDLEKSLLLKWGWVG